MWVALPPHAWPRSATRTSTMVPAVPSTASHVPSTVGAPVPASAPRHPLKYTSGSALRGPRRRLIGPCRYCSPHHRMPFHTRSEGAECVG